MSAGRLKSLGAAVCHLVSTRYTSGDGESGLGVPSRVRRLVTDCCESWGIRAVAEAGALMASELSTNAVLHAPGSPITVTVSLSGDLLEVDVGDLDPGPPTPRPMRTNLSADLEALDDAAARDATTTHDRHVGWEAGQAGPVTAGRGLLIVNALAQKWGVLQHPVGKDVWFTLAVVRAAGAPTCPCSDATDGRSIGSGRRVIELRASDPSRG